MSLGDLLTGHGELARRLPHRLEELRGPARGVIVLPRHLSWPGMREFDVSDDRRTLYVHALDCADPEAARRSIAEGFERRILEALR